VSVGTVPVVKGSPTDALSRLPSEAKMPIEDIETHRIEPGYRGMRALQILDGRAIRSWRRTVLALAVVFGVGLTVSGAAALAAAPAQSTNPVVTIRNFAFEGDLTVLTGATVVVRNADTVMHTLTAVDGSFTTPTIPPGGSATFKAPKKAASYAITCNFHPGMSGTLTVGQIVTPQPPPPTGPVVTISGFAFGGTLTVAPGATVTVRNDDPIMHTLTAVDGSFTTPTIDPGTEATFTAPATPGDYPITCNFHPFMEGTLTVAHH
jgi:plastocyanin